MTEQKKARLHINTANIISLFGLMIFIGFILVA